MSSLRIAAALGCAGEFLGTQARAPALQIIYNHKLLSLTLSHPIIIIRII